MSDQGRQYLRFIKSDRILHLLLLLSFTVLGLTGVPQKYADSGWAVSMIRFMGGIEQVRTIHHISAVVLILVSIAHIVQVGYRVFVMRVELDMFPTLKDFTDFVDAIKYNLDISEKHPDYARYNFMEKLEYWGVIWGTALMTVTGYVLWNPITTTKYLSGEVVPAAKIAHGLEAILAILTILTWHAYFVHISRFNKSIFTGYLDEEAMKEEHSAELEKRLAGEVRQPPDAETRWRRLVIYTPIATLFIIGSFLATWWFLTDETTAISTVPRIAAEEEAYKPVPLPTLELASQRPAPPEAPAVIPQPTPAPVTISSHDVGPEHSDCLLCHDPDGLIAPAPIDHKGRTNDQCLSCHQAGGGEQ
ncbi:MAG: cytochrome b/b6 domain-containing protein [Chloroflexota bacterium]|nr:cytochrome b/b6 domain-containing protein [Chloroflexota bacterium]